MPSLRRSLSSPTGRSSPYAHPYSFCPPSASAYSTRAGSRGPRRPSGSETSQRRVLADIDWWRIEPAQREVRGLAPHEPLRAASPSSSEDELDQEERAPSPSFAARASPTNIGRAPSPPLPGAGTGRDFEDSPSLLLNFPLGDVARHEPLDTSLPLAEFAALSISSQGRSTFRRSASVSSTFSDASFSSDSSYAYSPPSLSPMGLSFSFSDVIPRSSPDDSDDEVPLASLGAPASSRGSMSYPSFEDNFSYTGFSYQDPVDDPCPSFLHNAALDDWFH